jgi:Na+-transporting methylmalonyl-CoA/oxaloacetate decarboxylase gamma subunit
LFGFENISANNGWAMAVVGASIVFLGLVILSFVISQIHKILKFWEQKDKFFSRNKKQAQVEEPKPIKAPVSIQRHLPTVKELTSIYRPLVEQLKQPFQLIQLFDISNKMDLPHPHLSIKYLQEAGILVPLGDGTFTWDKQKAN